MKYSISAVTDLGVSRFENEDIFLISGNEVVTSSGRRFEAWSEGSGDFLVVVADGMGGPGAGVFAAECAAETIPGTVMDSPHDIPLHEIVHLALEKANQVVFDRSQNDPSVMGCGATVGLLVRRGDDVCLAQVGKVEIFIVRGRQQTKVFRACNWDDLVWCGGTPEGWPTKPEHALERLIINCLGGRDSFNASIGYFKVCPGDSFLLLSDGVSDRVSGAEICQLVSERNGKELSQELVRVGMECGGEDNLTAVVCRFGDSQTADSEVPILRDLKALQVQFTQESDLGQYVTEALKCSIRHGYFDMAKRIADSAPEDKHRDSLLGLLAEAEFPR